MVNFYLDFSSFSFNYHLFQLPIKQGSIILVKKGNIIPTSNFYFFINYSCIFLFFGSCFVITKFNF